MSRFLISGTDTNIGKTIFAAALADAIQAAYWKPVQAGLAGESDSETVARLSNAVILPEAYRLTQPLSPHRAAQLDGAEIDTDRLTLPDADPLVIEAAGGLLVPLTLDTLFIDVMERWRLPVILCARTGLGTINHTLLSLEALSARGIECHGIAFIGEDNPNTVSTIADMSGARILGRLPLLENLNQASLCAAFAENFMREDFA